MTEYEKLITAEQIAHTVEITECLTGKRGWQTLAPVEWPCSMAQRMETMIRLLRPGHSADSSKLQRPYWDKAADHPTKIVGKCVST